MKETVSFQGTCWRLGCVRFNSALLGFALLCLILGGWGCRRSGSQVLQEESVALPQGAIPFIYDGHLYVSAQLCDSLPVMLIFDSGADYLYLDRDYVDMSAFKELPLRKCRAWVGGAGNGGGQQVEMVLDSIPVRMETYVCTISPSPIIPLREIVGRHADAMLGNNWLFEKPLEINYGNTYLLRYDTLTDEQLQGYTRLPALFVEQRIYLEATLRLDAERILNGYFLLDMGCGSTIVLTDSIRRTLDLTDKPKAHWRYLAGGIGGSSDEFVLEAEAFSLLDTMVHLSVKFSLNQQGFMSSGFYLGIIGNKVLAHYDWLIDAPNQAVYARPNNGDGASATYWRSRTIKDEQMIYIDRTDIGDGWVVNGLRVGGIADTAGIGLGDTIVAINGRAVRDILWEEQRRGLNLKGETRYMVHKKDGGERNVVLWIGAR